MQIVTNQKYIDNRIKFARWGSALGFLLLIGGFAISIFYGVEMFLYEYAALILGFILFNAARHNAIRFEMKPSAHEVLISNLKGLDYKYRLYNYSSEVQTPHFMLSPYGIFVIETRHQWGDIHNSGSRWQHKRGAWEWLRTIAVGSIGNPSRDALRGVQTIRKYLQERLGEEQASPVSVEGVVVFTNPRARITTEEPEVPVVSPKDLRAYVRSPQGRDRMSPSLQRAVAEAFGGPEPSEAK